MASHAITRVDVFPEGTSVGAYPASQWSQAALPPTGAPPGAASATATMTNGQALFTGLGEGIAYYAGASVSGTWRYVAFIPKSVSANLQVYLQDQSILRATHGPDATLVNGTSLASGTMKLTAIPLQQGDVLNTIRFLSATTAAVTPTNQWACIVSQSTNKVLAVTADKLTEAWAAEAYKAFTLTAPYRVPTTGLYWIGLVVVAATLPTLRGHTSGIPYQTGPPATVRSDGVGGFTTPVAVDTTITMGTVTSHRIYADVA